MFGFFIFFSSRVGDWIEISDERQWDLSNQEKWLVHLCSLSCISVLCTWWWQNMGRQFSIGLWCLLSPSLLLTKWGCRCCCAVCVCMCRVLYKYYSFISLRVRADESVTSVGSTSQIKANYHVLPLPDVKRILLLLIPALALVPRSLCGCWKRDISIIFVSVINAPCQPRCHSVLRAPCSLCFIGCRITWLS